MWSKFGIPFHLYDLGFECITWLWETWLEEPLVFQETISQWNSNSHTHHGSFLHFGSNHVSQIELALRDLNFYSGGTPP